MHTEGGAEMSIRAMSREEIMKMIATMMDATATALETAGETAHTTEAGSSSSNREGGRIGATQEDEVTFDVTNVCS